MLNQMDAMPTEPHSFPSGFYLLVENAVDAVLEFPAGAAIEPGAADIAAAG